jgi:putative FmdB family regulatory protein
MLYEFECQSGHVSEFGFPMEDRPAFVSCPHCHRRAERIISAPTIHTLETHLRGVRDPDVKVNADGSYIDPNIYDRAKDEFPVIKSLKHKQETLKRLGLY